MSYLFLKEPYAIECRDNRINIINCKENKYEFMLGLKSEVTSDFLKRLSLSQIIELEELLRESNAKEKAVIGKLMSQDKYFELVDEITPEAKVKEVVMTEANRIGENFANTFGPTATYKVYKKIMENLSSTSVVLVGNELLLTNLIDELQAYGLKEIYIKSDKGALKKQPDGVKTVEDIEGFIQEHQKNKKHFFYAFDQNDCKDLYDFNELMEKYNTAWSLLAVTETDMIIGPTFFPKETGCLECNVDRDFWGNKTNILPEEAKIMAGLMSSDFCKIIGDMPEAIVEDISMTIGRMFMINRKTLNGINKDMVRSFDCKVCGAIVKDEDKEVEYRECN
ncbi:MAG: hypothetical protein IKW81_07020 [Pseudobutyrivibrio sp.]|nr:hypothetical protein [Pseudobutyrivibrio sp.]